jgi:outer membrane lipoprotein-sorting protein
MTMTPRPILIAFALVSLMSVPVAAQSLSGLDIAKKTKAALEPNAPSTRMLTISVNQGSKRTAQWTGAQARASENGVDYMVTAVLSPVQAKGMAVLARQQDSQPEQIWTYVPTLGRTVMLSPAAGFAPLFGSDFTFADLGFMELNNKYSYLGEATLGNTPVYKIQEIPSNNPYYSKIIAWIRKSDFLPLRRDFYNYAGALVQKEDYSGIQNIESIPTLTRIKMTLESSGNSTEFAFSDIQYNNKPPTGLFNPGQLQNLAKQPFWSQAGL